MTMNTLARRTWAVVALLSLMASTVSANAGKPETGAWTADFAGAKARADAEGIPMLVFWGNRGCGYCNKMKAAVATDEFEAWQASRGILMVKSEGDATVKEFVRNKSGLFPYMCVYWNRGDDGVVKTLFSGRSGKMPVKTGSLARQLIGSVERDIADWDGVAPAGPVARIDCGNTPGDRLEAQVWVTEYVDVPVRRDEGDAGVVDRLIWTLPSGRAATNDIAWAEGERRRLVRVAHGTEGFAAGERISLQVERDGFFSEKGEIAFVDRGNSPKNPAWIGTRTADELAFGEWTMDLDAATKKVAAFNAANPGARAYTLALVSGGVWCPDCARTDAYLADTPAFRAWAAGNNVACVCIDIPSDPTAGGPCLLSREVKEVNQTFMDADPDGGKFQSGAGYLSRWMVSDEAAAAALRRNAALVGVNTLNGGWNRPERANQTRTGVPVFLLLREDGAVAGRIETFASESPGDAGLAAGFIRRLDELLATADDKGGESDFHPSTTTREMAAQGGAAEMTLSGADTADTVRLTETVDYARLVVTADGTASGGLSSALSVYVKTNGAVSLVRKVTGRLSDGPLTNAVDMTVAGGEYFARLELVGLSDLAVFGQDAPIASAASVSSEVRCEAGEIAFASPEQSVFVPDGAGQVVVRRAGGMYGEASARVVVAEAGTAEGFYAFAETNLVWGAGETGDKTVPFDVFRTGSLASGSFTLALADGAGATVSDGTHVVTLNDTQDPCFEVFDMEVPSWAQFGTDRRFALRNVDPKKSVSLKKTSGALPRGMKLAYDRKTGEVVLSGTATAPGTYTATYTVTQGRVTGLPATVTVVVADPKERNAFVGDRRASQTLPLYAPVYGTTNLVAGTLTVAVGARNRISAKFQGVGRKALSFTGAWTEMAEDGRAVASLADRKGNALRLEMDGAGALAAVLRPAEALPAPFDGAASLESPSVGWPGAGFCVWAGNYTVTLVDRGAPAGRVEPMGTGCLALTVKANGAVRWSGTLPNGTAASGASQLLEPYVDDEGDDVAEAVLFKRTSKDVVAMTLAIKANADNWQDEAYAQMIHDAAGTTSYVLHQERDNSYVTCQSAYGGWYVPNIAPDRLCAAFGYDPDGISLTFATDALADSERDGALLPIAPSRLSAGGRSLAVVEAAEGVRFSFAAKTGLFQGSATLAFASGRKVKGKFKGALLPGWSSCPECTEGREFVARPFGSGTFYFKDTVNGRAFTRSLPVALNATAPEGE